ncbi:MAG TPA: pyridoxal 5'-phosphate synthase glutaminase subunit PdxT [Candidatus Peribacterales bacterium]|nr:pyridoxal 5'-phosphate synthase glutaminase subunit PdxT [Candidatus Peribacterales bacterium]
MNIGVLAFQGDVREHHRALAKFGVRSIDVRSIEEFERVDGLIIPGGESTVMAKFLKETGLFSRIIERAKNDHFPIYGTCAGAILLATEILHDDSVEPMKLIDITVERNAYGRQAESFSANISFAVEGETKSLPAIFIRAPRIVRVGSGVTTLGMIGGEPVVCREGNIFVSTFHPELLSNSSIIHRTFVEGVKNINRTSTSMQ